MEHCIISWASSHIHGEGNSLSMGCYMNRKNWYYYLYISSNTTRLTRRNSVRKQIIWDRPMGKLPCSRARAPSKFYNSEMERSGIQLQMIGISLFIRCSFHDRKMLKESLHIRTANDNQACRLEYQKGSCQACKKKKSTRKIHNSVNVDCVSIQITIKGHWTLINSK